MSKLRADLFRESTDPHVQALWERAIRIVLVLSAVVALTLAWLPVDLTVGRFLYDDMFYYLRVAQFIADGHGSTFDGISSTNGYHPAWMVVCVVFAWLAKGELLVHLVLTVAAALHVSQAYVLSRLLRRVASLPVVFALTTLYALNWRTLAINLCGLETPLATLMLLVVFLRMTGDRVALTVRFAASMGVLVGIAALARFDLLLLVGFVGMWLLLRSLRHGSVGTSQRLQAMAAYVAACVAVLSVWFIFSFSVSSTLLPNSRHAVRFLSGITYDFGDFFQITAMLKSQFWSAVWWSSDTANLFGIIPVIGGPHGTDLLGAAVLFSMVLGVAVVACLRRGDARVSMGGIALLYCLVHAGYYLVFHRIELRYVLPAIALFFVPLGAVITRLVAEWRSAWFARATALAVVTSFTFATIAGVSAYQHGFGSVRVHKYHYVAMDAARWLALNRPGERVGAWNAGILGYFSETALSNLDGVINDDALRAVANREIDRYILDARIRLIVDEPTQIRDNLQRFSRGGGSPAWLGPVVHTSRDDEGRMIVVREVLSR